MKTAPHRYIAKIARYEIPAVLGSIPLDAVPVFLQPFPVSIVCTLYPGSLKNPFSYYFFKYILLPYLSKQMICHGSINGFFIVYYK